MFTKAATVFAVAIVFGAASMAPAMSASSKSRAAKAAAQSYAQFFRLDRRPHSSNPANDVYDTTGRYLGSDPDPLVRFDLVRNPPNRY